MPAAEPASLINSGSRVKARDDLHEGLCGIFADYQFLIFGYLETPLSILKRYWKHIAFRPMQEDIITSVLKHQDTLALLPTGGGKSVCFQVPAMLLDGLCLVISPLIALMKDQVEGLKRKGIAAIAIHSGMSRAEIDRLLDNCIHDHVKFLYVSPERLQTELFIARVKQMKVALVVIDEAHCISQWGYDFRPPYLRIAELREVLTEAPVIALTATATHQVKDDIVEKLAFRGEFEIFQRTCAIATGTACLLIIRLQVFGKIHMHHGTHIGFINTHSKSIGGNHYPAFSLDPIVLMFSTLLETQARMINGC